MAILKGAARTKYFLKNKCRNNMADKKSKAAIIVASMRKQAASSSHEMNLFHD